MFKPIEPVNSYKPEYGDILPYSKSNLLKEFKKKEGKYFVPLWAVGKKEAFHLFNPERQMENLNISSDFLEKYECPYTSKQYYSIIPLALISEDLSQYLFEKNNNLYEIYYDKEWCWEQYFFNEGEKLPKIQSSLLGAGYTSGATINDGSNNLIFINIQLDNGDELYCVTFEWYNK